MPGANAVNPTFLRAWTTPRVSVCTTAGPSIPHRAMKSPRPGWRNGSPHLAVHHFSAVHNIPRLMFCIKINLNNGPPDAYVPAAPCSEQSTAMCLCTCLANLRTSSLNSLLTALHLPQMQPMQFRARCESVARGCLCWQLRCAASGLRRPDPSSVSSRLRRPSVSLASWLVELAKRGSTAGRPCCSGV